MTPFLANAEWKAATVLAGSVIEALLLDSIALYKSDNSGGFLKKLAFAMREKGENVSSDNKKRYDSIQKKKALRRIESFHSSSPRR